MRKVYMVVPQRDVKGGIAAVVEGYHGSDLEQNCEITYIESYRDGSKWQKLAKALEGYHAFRVALRKARPDVVHIHSSFGPSFYRKIPFILIASHRGIPIVNHIHGAEFDRFYTNASKGKKALISSIYHKCDALIALSSEWEERLSRIVPKDRIHTIWNYSIAHEEILVDQALAEVRRKKHQVLFLGELGHRKGAYDIPAVVSKVWETVPEAVFLMAGAGEDEQVHAAFAKELQDQYPNWEKQVLFPGWIRGAKKDTALRESCIFFLPSYQEGMPMSILDAMGYALPIVSTNVGGIPRLVHTDENGALIAPGDTTAAAKALTTLLVDPARCEREGAQSLALIQERYSLKAHVKALLAVYESVNPTTTPKEEVR